MPAAIDVEQLDLEALVEAFELSRADHPEVDFRSFVPSPRHPEYAEIVVELSRADLEFACLAGERRQLDAYLSEYPEVFDDPERRACLAFEEFRLRGRQAGKSAAKYAKEFEIDTSHWPRLEAASQVPFPEIGDTLGDFKIIGELGRGAFGRVYLAQQGELAYRFVALKVTIEPNAEPQRLAELQHTNIVPIHSVHRQGSLQAVCMPLLGTATLADFLDDGGLAGGLPPSGAAFISYLRKRKLNSADGLRTADNGRSLVAARLPDPPRCESISEDSYPDAVARICSQIAAGLAHAHRNGIIHRDLKPANILLRDDGTPLLLDFNLATKPARRSASEALVGGTLPYMAPEHLQSLLSGEGIGPTADVYSLGVILFELLSTRRPYPDYEGPVEVVVGRMLEDRRGSPASLSYQSPPFSPDLTAIATRALAMEPADRYQSAQQMQTDLERHLRHLPLRHARSSWLERIRKWLRRHPRVASGSTVGLVAGALLLLLTVGFLSRARYVAEADAERTAFTLEQTASSVASLASGQIDLASLLEAIAEARALLLRHSALHDNRWQNQPPYALLRDSARITYREHIHTTQFLLATGHVRAAHQVADRQQAAELLSEAERLLELVAAGFDSTPRAVLEARAQIAFAREDPDLAAKLQATAASTPAETDFEEYLLALAAPHAALVEKLCQKMPHRSLVWLMMGNLHFKQLRLIRAADCYSQCIVLERDSFLAHLMRGIARYHLREFDEAEADFNRALQLRPDWPAARFNQGLNYQARGKLAEAEKLMTIALEHGATESRIYFARARLRRAMGMTDEAEQDLKTGLQATPTDAPSWIARGVHQPAPELALADFRQAARIDPRSVAAWNNIANVLAERLGKTEEAIAAMDRLIELNPSSATALATRGVLRARLGETSPARRDAAAALALSSSHDTQYQVAGIFALLSRFHSADAERGIELLWEAARKRPQYVQRFLQRDPDLVLVRDHPRFRQLSLWLKAVQ